MSRCEAIVVAVSGTEAEVEVPERGHACGSCKSADGCQTGLLGLTAGPRRYRVENLIGARPGDRVALDVADGNLLRASLVSYLWPALLAIGGAVIGQMRGGDGAALAGMLIGLICGVILLRWSELRTRRNGSLLSLHVLSKQVHLFKETP